MKITKMSNYPALKALFKKAFPDYKGRKFHVETQTGPMNIASYWSGGTRTYFEIVRLEDNETLSVPAGHPMFDKALPNDGEYEAQPGFVLVSEVFFCGHKLGLTAYFHPDDATQLLEVTV